jgi:hypothetical protein
MNDLFPVVHNTPELRRMPEVFLPRQRLSANPLRTTVAAKILSVLAMSLDLPASQS